ncbi:phosphoadenylylsulfate reductase [Formosa sp. Hel1_33_131]|uniref:phosphoadenosine phosphosulfate reductase domain-containing protein n=1 Tax=Formosa sp. Hel1_33_131 TaxID=1336794 RepID=UPI00084E1DEE|nr:phosphoadenosine phosphosulfate reductase family protein [Formosa sp. Hel1_33_131]AOR28637.1 phosphoadenylylsulfate reductase [Formosa sp. Hel1_33_131]
MDIEQINTELATKTPIEIVQWALIHGQSPIVTTNFRPYESAILHLVTKVDPAIKVIWCDTGYNTSSTYKHAAELMESLALNIQLYIPKQTAAHRDVVLGIPQVDDPKHSLFTEQVKLEPFKRAMAAHQPDVWFTNLRKGQTAFRNSIGIVSRSADGVLKISPFYHFSDKDLDQYLKEHNLPNEFNYFDPTKQLDTRECGLHN